MCVCLSASIFPGLYTSDLHQIVVDVTYGRGSVLLVGFDTLCTSGLWMTSCFQTVATNRRILKLTHQGAATNRGEV